MVKKRASKYVQTSYPEYTANFEGCDEWEEEGGFLKEVELQIQSYGEVLDGIEMAGRGI